MKQDPNTNFNWQRHPDAADLIGHLVQSMVTALPFAVVLERRMREETGTRLVDWIDHLCLPHTSETSDALSRCGYHAEETTSQQAWRHEGAMVPVIRLGDFDAMRIAIKVESVADFLHVHDSDSTVHGVLNSPLRTSCVADGEGAELWVVERHGTRKFTIEEVTQVQTAAATKHARSFLRRKRDFVSEETGFDHAEKLIGAATEDLGTDWACDLFFAAERDYWCSRNRAARLQKNRQDKLGLGWANHDHHTYRSSRECFARLIGVLEKLGCRCRERFYGGADAGWGAQVLEQSAAGIVIFADVDLSPTEVTGDFAHNGLSPRDDLGTVGLWCKLHGEAMLQAGMHHLECQFDFDAARTQLAAEGIKTMKPFTDFEHLKQAFTEGEMWVVSRSRLETAVARGWITRSDAQRFRELGTIGSHLEILQRDDGYKGFNQTGISEIIRQTDPRRPFGA